MTRRLCDYVISPSKEMRDTFVNVHRCSAETVEVIYHGMDFDRLDPGLADGARFRTEQGLEGKLVIGVVSRYFWVKNLIALVRAFAGIAADEPDAILVIVGGHGDSGEVARVVESLALSDRVRILGLRRDIPDVLAAFDVFVHAALAESFGQVIVEAMAMARPVVTTPVGIAREIVEDGVSGVLCKGTSPEDLRQGIVEALMLRDRWPELGAEARRRTLTFTPERMV